ncbi:efflux RND transporter periplasmic adaptor subunit [Alsobacter sp. SYSU M60028]|uniref:Efflux RND transporter periplasmic adaptor subunit n=1 Tax=Alsobacter ponti TaxID=2962936 RepID=A0ABT1L873_9HYPH|nr:efflux RND transporter periplasmic adaptor subunit [Alsobacter ponti]MCP8937657.1 efflux RND transporter periplasmic adaptor subunit [Alsobacter ponti]
MFFSTVRIAALAGGVMAASGFAQAQTPPAPPTVLVTPVTLTDITSQADFLGRIQATDKVELRARVQGFLTERRFTEGQMVKEGDILFVIDKAPFEAALDQVKAELASAKALAQNAELQLARTRELAEKGNAPQATLDQRIAEDAKAKADIMRVEAALRSAEINLSWTDVKAPISGRIGQAQVTRGNLVGPSSPPLATLVSVDPINVTFPVTQRELLQARQRAGGEPQRIGVRLRLADGSVYGETGHVQLLDVQSNQGTDSVTVRASIANPDGVLIDGASIRVLLDIGEPEKRMTTPSSAIAIDQQGPFVLVVGQGEKVEIKRLTLGPQRGGMAVVEKGLAVGDRVIVEGGQRVRPGMQVTPMLSPTGPKS